MMKTPRVQNSSKMRVMLVAGATIFATMISLPAAAVSSSPDVARSDLVASESTGVSQVPLVAADTCVALTRGDHVHKSGSDASGHGWWEIVDCPKGTKAVVTIDIQKQGILGIWSDVGAQGKKTVYAGGGSANRAAGRYTCSGSSNNDFRSKIDVDLIDYLDLPDKLHTPEKNLACG
ncbi:MAG: hypothetical protein LBK95_03760 [Bifidobacteriaceae bacterium]|jgi:hypothetical protein|nr:hypothetical protein [Bifidobacteriaceae bacterium]